MTEPQKTKIGTARCSRRCLPLLPLGSVWCNEIHKGISQSESNPLERYSSVCTYHHLNLFGRFPRRLPAAQLDIYLKRVYSKWHLPTMDATVVSVRHFSQPLHDGYWHAPRVTWHRWQHFLGPGNAGRILLHQQQYRTSA